MQRTVKNRIPIIAHYWLKHPKVEKVYWPFENHPNTAYPKKQWKLGGGGMISFILKELDMQMPKENENIKCFHLGKSLEGWIARVHPLLWLNASIQPKEERNK